MVRARDLWPMADTSLVRRAAWAHKLGCSVQDLPDFAALLIFNPCTHDRRGRRRDELATEHPVIDWGAATHRAAGMA